MYRTYEESKRHAITITKVHDSPSEESDEFEPAETEVDRKPKEVSENESTTSDESLSYHTASKSGVAEKGITGITVTEIHYNCVPNEENAVVDDNVSDSDDDHTSVDAGSDTLDMGSLDINETSVERGGGDADLNSTPNPGRQIIQVNIVHKKRERDPEAYSKWLKSKNDEIRKNREKEMLIQQELRMKKKLEEEKRKEVNKKKIQQWMERKGCSRARVSSNSDTFSNNMSSDWDAKFEMWLARVKKQDIEKKERERCKQQMEKEMREEKEKQSKRIYQEWLEKAKNKPKPVPLNQGLNTLRGTVSKLFVNPEPWRMWD